MSTPLLRHNLAREIERGAGGEYVPARFAQMRCDGGMGSCRIPPQRAPRIVVPPHIPQSGRLPRIGARIFGFVAGARPLRLMTTLHYCRAHQSEIVIEEVLSGPRKRQIEQAARVRWPLGVRPDFEAAWIDWVLVTTPEYLAFLADIEVKRRSVGGVPIL